MVAYVDPNATAREQTATVFTDGLSNANAIASDQLAQLAQYADTLLNTALVYPDASALLQSALQESGLVNLDSTGLLPDGSDSTAEELPETTYAELYALQAPDDGIYEPELVDVDEVDLDPAPSDSLMPNERDFAPTPLDRPDAFVGTAPVRGYTLDVANIPEQPDLTALFPELPVWLDYETLTLPTVDPIAFDVTFVDSDLTPPSEQLDYTPTEYTTQYVDDAMAYISAQFANGGTGLTPAAELASFERARAREEQNAFRALQEADDDFVSRGFDTPNGILFKRRQQVRQNNQNQANAFSREVKIENEKLQIESLRFAVQQSLALEQMFIQLHNASEQRLFEAARARYESVIALYNARIAVHNANVELYKANADIWERGIRAQMAQVELYRAQVEGNQAVASTNRALADVYEAQFRGVTARIDAYRAEIDGAKAVFEANKEKIEEFRSEISLYEAQVRAYATEWTAYGEGARANTALAQNYDTALRAFMTRVDIWKTQQQPYFEKHRADIEANNNQIAMMQADTQRWATQFGVSKDLVSAQADLVRAQASQAEVDVRAAGVLNDFNAQKERIAVQKMQMELTARIQALDVDMRRAVQQESFRLDSLRQLAGLSAQISASAMATLNLSAGLSSTASSSGSYAHNVNISYDGGEA